MLSRRFLPAAPLALVGLLLIVATSFADSGAPAADAKLLPSSTTALAGAVPQGSSSSSLVRFDAAAKRALLGLAEEDGDGELPSILLGLASESADLPSALDLESLGLEELRRIPELGIVELRLRAGRLPLSGLQEQAMSRADRVPEMLARLDGLEGVAWAEQETRHEILRLPDDPAYRHQWGATRVGLESAWDITLGSRSVTIAIVDTGIDSRLPDFEGKLVSPYSVEYGTSEYPAWVDVLGHGTGVAGVAAALGDNGYGMVGAGWDLQIMPVHLADGPNWTDADFAAGVTWAVDHGADVINYSAGGEVGTETERRAVDYALSRGVTLVAAAGNGGPGAGLTYPAAYPGVVAVGAINSSDVRSYFSQTGPALDLVAPGEEIASWALDPATDQWVLVGQYGTSFSSPLVAGTVGLMLSLDPSLTPEAVHQLLRITADDLGVAGWDASYGSGILDADGVVDKVRTATTTTSLPATTTTSLPPTTTTLPPSTTTTRPPTTTTLPPGSTTTTVPSTTTTLPPVFGDVPGSHPYAAQINDLAARGVLSGFGDGSFRPDDPLKRQQFAKVIVLALGYPVSEADSCPFTDVDHPADNLYPDNYVAVCAARGITMGTSPGKFSPWQNISRAQLITMVARTADLPEPPPGYQPPFANFSSTHYPWARKAAYAGLLGGLQGVGAGYDFWAPASRGEVSALLYNLLHR